MYTLDELKEKLDNEYKGFDINCLRLDNGFVSEFTISRTIGDDLLLYVYFWDSKYDSYISYLTL